MAKTARRSLEQLHFVAPALKLLDYANLEPHM